jgi:hypothetical protein
LSASLNCHFVSRFLTKPWEFGERQLHYYDFKTRKFEVRSSRNLFARRGSNSVEVERRLNALIETPLSQAIDDLTRMSDNGESGISDWPTFRALCLLVPFQIARVARKREADDADLASMCRWPEAKVDEFASAWSQTHKFLKIRAHPGCPFFYPSSGFFIIPLPKTPSMYPTALAIPLTERYAAAVVPAEIDENQIYECLRYGGGGLASNSSVSTNAERVVIHPAVMECSPRDEMAAQLHEMQANNLRLIQACVDLSRTIAEAFSLVGIGPQEALRIMCSPDKK